MTSAVPSEGIHDYPPIPSLTGIRALAAISVVVSHSLATAPPFSHGVPLWFSELEDSSGFGMTCFFVLSGFVIHYNYSESIVRSRWRGLWNFYVARFARLYPLFLLGVMATLFYKGTFINAVHNQGDNRSMLTTSLPYFLTLTQSWFYNVHNGQSLVYQLPYLSIGLTWSVSTEWFFYLVYPGLLWVLRRLKSMAQFLVMGLVISGCAFTLLALVFNNEAAIERYAVRHFGPVAGMTYLGGQDSLVRWIVYFSPYSRSFEFALGALVATLYMRIAATPLKEWEIRWGPPISYGAALAVVAEFFVMWLPGTPFGFLTFSANSFGLALPLAALLFCLARYRHNLLYNFFSARWIVLCGEASYSIYLLQFIALGELRSDFANLDPYYWYHTLVILGRSFLAVIQTIGLAIVANITFERPTRRWLRAHLSVRPERDAGGALILEQEPAKSFAGSHKSPLSVDRAPRTASKPRRRQPGKH
jgi:peptidoglycan/LPS O-acetylase OafA/YrhL